MICKNKKAIRRNDPSNYVASTHSITGVECKHNRAKTFCESLSGFILIDDVVFDGNANVCVEIETRTSRLGYL